MDSPLMTGFVTVNVAELLPVPFTVTMTPTLPFAVPDGTLAVMEVPVLLQFVTEATMPPNLTVLEPWLEPKPVPVIITDVPVAPEVGFRLDMTGAANREPLASTRKSRTATEANTERDERMQTPIQRLSGDTDPSDKA